MNHHTDLCEHHGVREWRRRAPLAVRLLRAVVVSDDECWLWQGRRDEYISVRLGRRDLFRSVPAHRPAYEVFIAAIPAGLEVDHLCRQPSCINPKHLEPVTGRENKLRGTSFSALNARKTECKNGHTFTPENTIDTGRGNRACRTCSRDHSREYMRRKATSSTCATNAQDDVESVTVQGLRKGESE